MFSLPCDNWKVLIFIWICRYSEFFPSVMLFHYSKNVFWKKSVFQIRYIHNSIAVQYQKSKINWSYIYLTDFNLHSLDLECTFFLIFEIFSKSSKPLWKHAFYKVKTKSQSDLQERSQNLKQVPQNFLKVFNVDDVTLSS